MIRLKRFAPVALAAIPLVPHGPSWSFLCLKPPVLCGGPEKGSADARRLQKDAFPHDMVNGIMQPPGFQQAAFDDLQANWQLRDSDIVVASYPKCGTTWMQQIVLLLLFKGDKDKVKRPMEQAPFIEAIVSDYISDDPLAKTRAGIVGKPRSVQELADWDGSTEDTAAPPYGRVFKTHCQAHDVPWKGGVAGRGKARIIVIVRNPKDTCISFYHHKKHLPFDMGPGVANINTFAQRFLEGEVHHGDFWEWHAGWEKAIAGDSGTHWVSYEAIKSDPFGEIRKIADFLGIEASDEIVEKVAGKSSFSSMKEQFAENNDKLMGKGLAVKTGHVRQGQAGSWRNDIFGDLNSQFDEVHASKCAAFGLKYQFDFGDA